MKKRVLILVLAMLGVALTAHQSGMLEAYLAAPRAKPETAAVETNTGPPAPAVSVVKAVEADFVETVMITGSFAAREEIIVAPEVDGLRVLELKAEEGDRVKKGDVLAVLVTEQLEAQLAANKAALGSASASIERAKSQINEMEARVTEAKAQLERARPLAKSQYLSESVLDQRELAAKSAEAQLASAKGGLAQAEAEKVQIEAQGRELQWRLDRAAVRAPADGIISRRGARIGGLALGNSFSGGDPMFRIIEKGEIELDAEVAETHLWKVKPGQKARVMSSSGREVEGTVRLVAQEVDKATRLGHVRIFLGNNPELKIGAFGRGTIETGRSRGIAVPLSAVLYSDDGPSVQVVAGGKVSTHAVKTGLETAGMIAVTGGLTSGDLVVAKAGTFLRDGDAVRPVEPDAVLSSKGQSNAAREATR
jgi:HlyD family secretion protein